MAIDTGDVARHTHGQRNAQRESVAAGEKDDPILPLALHGAEFSYFTGKLEGVIRFMELPYQRIPGGPTSDAARAKARSCVTCCSTGSHSARKGRLTHTKSGS